MSCSLPIPQCSTTPANLALGKPYTFDITPDYSGCTDAGDITQLTDGNYGADCDPTNISTVGWKRRYVGYDNECPAEITIDLGQVEPISGVSFRTSAGVGVSSYWPYSIVILVSNDGINFYNAGELLELSYREGNIPPVTGTGTYRTLGLQTYGRYVRFVVRMPSLIFSDEIEISVILSRGTTM